MRLPAGLTRRGMKIARFGDNMRNVAVTEGDKVEAELRFGYSVNGYGIGDLVAAMKEVTDRDIDTLLGSTKGSTSWLLR